MSNLYVFYIDKKGEFISTENFPKEKEKNPNEKISEHSRIARNIINMDAKLKKEFATSRWSEDERYDLFLIEKGYVAVGCFEIEGGVVLYNSSLISEKQKEKIDEYNENKFMIADYGKSKTLAKSTDNGNKAEAETDGR